MAGGSQIIINKEGITFITPAKFEAKAGQHLFKNGAKVSTQLPTLPVAKQPYILQYLVKAKDNIPLANKPYFIIDQAGNLQKGVTNAEGLMKLNTTPSAQDLVTHVMASEIEEAQEVGGEEE
ncbi:hypothetical protein M5F03_01420 [Acinetobacter sp. ANC 5579]|uniref:hypothetical protein n=1 Tax=Acinetobacter amyesii TaxID=2942470 RepID=UPI0020BFB96A|nr:hypothetical protein [Acinetobacter amyesii]MCL6233841.1 hypothetical protein [Acinetobacter amyesii]